MNGSDRRAPDSDPFAFLKGGGEMGRLIRSMNWSASPLGPVEAWPQSLRTTVSICLASDLPICVIWGPGLVQLYNDAYRVICGNKHPRSMGQNFSECWKEAWPVIGEAHDSALAGDTAFLESQQIFLERHGYLEECFFTFSFSPIRDEAGRVGGLFHPVIEMTTQVLSQRRTRTLSDLTAQTSKAKSVGEALSLSADALAGYAHDLPFVLFYALDPDGSQARLISAPRHAAETVASQGTVDFSASDPAAWPLEEVVRCGSAVQLSDIGSKIGPASFGPYTEAPTEALALPIIPPGATRAAAIFIAGLSPRLRMDEAYRSFYDMLAAAVTTAVGNARAHEDELRRARALAELDRAKTNFFSNVSHEFRTPLTLMLGPIEDALAASDEETPPLQRERLELIHRNGLRLQRLVNTLLDFSRIEAGRGHAAYEPTALADFTADLASNFRSACEKAGLDLRVDCPPLGEPVYVDRVMWEKVVLNLLSNAFKFTFEGAIAVSLRQADRTVELRVSDTGIGVPAAEVPLLFERFHRVENARGRTHEGSGIGLALVQELVKLHGGSITAESEVGRGTTFTISIPLGSVHLPQNQVGNAPTVVQPTAGANSFVEEALRWLPEADQRPAPEPQSASFQGDPSGPALPSRQTDEARPLVLVADDNADMRQYLARLLGEHYRIDTAPDGMAALAMARKQLPDLILTDVMMPRLDGFGLLQALRADPGTRGVPVIMLSARAGEESRVEGMQGGADDYLVKPFSARELLARITAHLQMARMRRESYEALRQSEERFRALVNATSDSVYQMSADWTEMRHLQGREFIADTHEPSRSWLDKYIPAQDQPQILATIDAAIRSKGVFELEHRVIRVDGTPGWTFSRAIPLLDTRGAVVEWFGMASDVTIRKDAEQSLRESETRIRAFADAAPAMLWETDPAGHCTFLSQEWYSFTGQTEAQALGLGWTLATHPDDQAEAGRVFLVANARRDEFALEYRLRGDGGAYRWALDVGRPRFAATGEYLGMVGVVIDIDDRKRAEEALRASEERRRLALDAAELGMWHMEPATRAMQTDARFRAIFGTTENWTDYLHVLAVVHPDDLPAVQTAVAAAIRLEEPAPYAIEYRIVHPDGSLRWVYAKGRSSIEGAGPTRRVVSFDGTVADITVRKQGEQEREELVARLREQDQRKDEFLATLAHELRNPLAPIRNGLQIMRLAQGDADANERIRSMMERQLGQMVHLIDDLLDLSRISRGKIDLRKERIELAKALQQAIEASGPAIAAAQHELQIKLPSDPVYVDADPTRIAQVFSNLLNNAAKFTDRGGRIELGMHLAGTQAVVSIQDNGSGISTQMLPHVFEMFTQVEGNLERSKGGLGIGLSIVKRLVEMHGGSVEARSGGHGKGSEFIVRLPLAQSTAGDDPGDQPDPVHATTRHRILVVDDNVDAAQSLSTLLAMMGNETLAAHDGLEAFGIAAVFKPDVMFVDIGMPKLNGYELSRRIRQQPWGKDIVLIALTGWGQDEDMRKSLEAGLDSHLTKPVLPATLEKLLARVSAAKGSGLPGSFSSLLTATV